MRRGRPSPRDVRNAGHRGRQALRTDNGARDAPTPCSRAAALGGHGPAQRRRGRSAATTGTRSGSCGHPREPGLWRIPSSRCEGPPRRQARRSAWADLGNEVHGTTGNRRVCVLLRREGSTSPSSCGCRRHVPDRRPAKRDIAGAPSRCLVTSSLGRLPARRRHARARMDPTPHAPARRVHAGSVLARLRRC